MRIIKAPPASFVPPHLSYRHQHTAEDTKPRGCDHFNIVVSVPSELLSPPLTPPDPPQASCSPPTAGTDTPAPASRLRIVAGQARKWYAVRHGSSTMRPRSAAACPLAARQLDNHQVRVHRRCQPVARQVRARRPLLVWTQHPALPLIKGDSGTGGVAIKTKRQRQASQVAMLALMKIREMSHHPKISKIPNRKRTMKHLLRRFIR